jgi:dephospho-CoA kinase
MIIGIAGSIASGKSTLARALANEFSLKLIAFGDFVRQEARARGLDVGDRQVLQDLGQSLVDEDVSSFVAGVFTRADYRAEDRIVLDGVRHESVWEEISALAASHESTASLVFLVMPEEERRNRLTARGLSADQVSALDRHASEADVRVRLAEKADIRVDALQSREVMLALIAHQLGLP